jgi:ABC-type multidrug transport system fused ATPase/permease subunit
VLIFLVKTIFLIYLSYRQNRFIGGVSATISSRLFEKYLGVDYTFHLKRNSAELMRNLQQEVAFFIAFFQSFISTIVEVLLLFSVVLTLVIIEPIGALSLGIFLSFISYLFFQITKKRLSVWGKQRQDLDGLISQIILETLTGIKEIKVKGKEVFFLKKYTSNTLYKAYVNALFTTINLVPRYYLEFMSIFALASFITIMLFQGRPLTSLIIIVGVFVAAIFRMLPSVNKIISSLQVIKYKKYALDVLLKEFKQIKFSGFPKTVVTNSYPIKKTIAIKGLNFNYNSTTKVLKNASFEIKKGNVVGIIGESGAGKSTLVDVILGLYPANHDNIFIDGTPILDNIRLFQNNVGYVAQDIFLMDNSIKNNIALGIPEDEIDVNRVNEVIQLAQIKSFVNTLPNGINTIVGEHGDQLSGGQRQRIGIARALYQNPEVLIFDEATSALDNETEREILNVIFSLKKGKTIIMIAHRLSTLDKCDEVYQIKKGEINPIELGLKSS